MHGFFLVYFCKHTSIHSYIPSFIACLTHGLQLFKIFSVQEMCGLHVNLMSGCKAFIVISCDTELSTLTLLFIGKQWSICGNNAALCGKQS